MANEKILVVDDDKNICELLRLYLVKEGYNVTMVHDGSAALTEFDKLHPDLVLLDVMMPVMDGYQVLNTIRNMEKQRGIEGDDRVKIIMMTALNEQKNVRKAFEMGCTVYCAKPVDLDKLKNVLKKLKLI